MCGIDEVSKVTYFENLCATSPSKNGRRAWHYDAVSGLFIDSGTRLC